MRIPSSVGADQGMFGKDWLPCRRFGLWQRNKLRAIDDLTESAVNQAWEVMERVSLPALDEIGWLCMAIMKVAASRNVDAQEIRRRDLWAGASLMGAISLEM